LISPDARGLHAPPFSDAERAAVYRAIEERRDVRAQFVADPVPDEVLSRILGAAHRAPSVGFSQPWRFIVVRERATREAVHASFERANAAAGAEYDQERALAYRRLCLAGILDAPVNLCVVCDDEPSRGAGLGRRTMPETPRYSTVCAIQNLWLAARAEGVGVGWVSIVEPAELRRLFGIPPRYALVGYLCVGYVDAFAAQPDLERSSWERRLPLEQVVDYERFDHSRAGSTG
jgi:5,6-dimethylbenzimidazole synthase